MFAQHKLFCGLIKPTDFVVIMAEEETGQLGLETELAGAEVKSVTEKRVGKLTHKALLEKISILEKERKSILFLNSWVIKNM